MKATVQIPDIHRPPTVAQALAQVRAWLESPSLVLLSESGSHPAALEKLLVTGPRVHDARIAALCVEHSADRDFARVPDISVENPLVPPA